MFDAPGKVTDPSKLRPPTDATQSRPYLGPVPPPATWACHLPPENGTHKKGQHIVLSPPPASQRFPSLAPSLCLFSVPANWPTDQPINWSL